MSKTTRPSPSASATLYAVGTKKKGGDGNIWIIKEDKNKNKRWGLYKKTQTLPASKVKPNTSKSTTSKVKPNTSKSTTSKVKPNTSKSKTAKSATGKKSKPKFYNLDICISATALLWNQDKFESFTPESVVKNKSHLKTVLNSIHNFSEPIWTINFTFKKLLRSKPKIIWKGSDVDINIPIKIRSERKNYDLLLEQINQFVNDFQDGASDGYLEGDAVVYKVGNDIYEFVLEDILVEIYHKDDILKRITYPAYW